ncbi:MAG: hypothetical protein WBV41_00470, partial [Terriglobales bacterium]
MYAPIYDKITYDAECDQKVHGKKKDVMVEYKVKAGKGRIHEPAGSDKHEPAVEFGPFLPIDGKRNDHGKGGHAVERDRQKSICVAQMELSCIESGHDNGYGNTQRNHHRREPSSKPAEEAMPVHFVYTDQRGL